MVTRELTGAAPSFDAPSTLNEAREDLKPVTDMFTAEPDTSGQGVLWTIRK